MQRQEITSKRLHINLRWIRSENTKCLFKGIFHISKIPRGYKQIRVHAYYDVKYDGRHKARLVADGHLTDVPIDSFYAGVVSLQGLRMCLFLAELNGMEAYATNIGNAYLKVYTTKKSVITAVWMSKRPMEMAYCIAPIKLW